MFVTSNERVCVSWHDSMRVCLQQMQAASHSEQGVACSGPISLAQVDTTTFFVFLHLFCAARLAKQGTLSSCSMQGRMCLALVLLAS